MQDIKKRPFVGISIIILLVSLPTFTSSGAATHQRSTTVPESQSSVVSAGLPGTLPDSINKSGSPLVQGSMVKVAPPSTSKTGSSLSATAGTIISPSTSFLGTPLCPALISDCSSNPYWEAGYMDQAVSPQTADAVTALVSLPSTSGIENDFIQPGNYLALGIMGQSQTKPRTSGCPQTCDSLDYANFAMLYLAPNAVPMIIGEVWTSPNPTETPQLIWNKGWANPNISWYRTMGITMRWNQTTGNLDWIVRLYGVEQTLFSYTPNQTQEQYFHVGTVIDNTQKAKWFQFGVMSRNLASYPVSPWKAYIASPQYLSSGTWHPVDTASLTEGSDAWVDGGAFVVGGVHFASESTDTCKSGGHFPVFNDLLRSGQVIFHYDPSALPSAVVWDSTCPVDPTSPTSAFSSPGDGTWQTSSFGIAFTDSDPGQVVTGVEQCYWAVSSWNGVSWVQTRATTVRQCNFVSGVTVGPSGDCPNEGSRSCRVDLWAEDRVGNIGTVVSRYFSIETVPPSTPSLLSPANGAVTSNTPTYNWSPSTSASGIAYYFVDRSTDPTFPTCPNPCPILLNLITSTSYTESTPLNYGVWRWRVEVFDNADIRPRTVSPTGQFTVSPFAVSTSPTSATALRGATATSTITVTSLGGFSGTVALSATVSPVVNNGPTAVLSRTSLSLTSGGSSTSSLTLSTTSSTPTSQYTVTITGTSGSQSQSAALSLSVVDFTLSANPTSSSTLAGNTASSLISVTPSGSFTGTVTLSASSTPSGLTCSLSNTSITGGSGSQTLYCNGGTGGTTYTITVTGTSGSLTHTTPVTFTFITPYSFRDDFTYTSVSSMVSAGWTNCGTTSGQVSLSNSILSLTNDGTNVGDMCWSNIPASVTSWTVSTRGQYGTQLTNYGYGPTNGATWISINTASHLYQFDLDGYYKSYYLYRDGVKIQTTPGYTPQLGAWHDLTLDMRNGVLTAIADGKTITTYNEVAGTNNALTSVAMMPGWDTVTNYDWVTISQVNPSTPANFALGLSPITQKVAKTTNAVVTINLSSLAGFSGTVSLTKSILPSTGLTCTLSPTSVSLTSSATSTLTCSGLAGTYIVTVTGTNGSLSHTTTATITLVTYTLTLQGFDYDGGQEETIKLNNQLVAQLPTQGTPQNAQIYVTFTLDVTAFVVKGTNTLTFTHANWDCQVVDNTKNVQITDSTGTIIFSDPTIRPLSCTQSITYTFTM